MSDTVRQVAAVTAAIRIEAHPPERRRRAASVAACGSCCCCCCVHSLGGLIGAAVLSPSTSSEERRATALYWVTLLVGSLIPFVLDRRGGFLMVLLLLPAIQLGTTVVTGVLAGFSTLVLRSPVSQRRIWRIAWRGLLGAVLGAVVMVVGFLAMNGWRW